MTKNPTSGKRSLKFSQKIQKMFGGKVPSIYETQRGDLYCTLNRKKIYLGRDPKAAKAKLIQILTDAAQAQPPRPAQPIVEKSELSPSPAAFVTPAELPKEEPVAKPRPAKPKAPIVEKAPGLTITELIARFLETVKGDSHFSTIRTAMRVLNELYGSTEAETFGPLALKACRERFCAADYDRNYINRMVTYIIRMFKFGVANELVTENVAIRLSYVTHLKQGEARENAPREDVPDSEIIKTLPHLLPTIRDMVILQRISGMRPSELFRMTLEQFVKRDPDGWVYMPFKHKTQIHNKSRVIAFGKYEIAILERHARGKQPDEPLFSPRDAWLERAERLGYKTPQPQPNYNNYYTKDSYSTNIARTIKRANERMRKEGRPESDLIRHWSPYQLRHATATFLSLLMSRDDAATALGHASTNTTQIYDHSEVEKALRFVRERDKTCGGAIAGLIHQFE